MIAAELATELGHDLGLGSVTDVTDAIAAHVAAYAGITTAALAANRDGLVTSVDGVHTPCNLDDRAVTATPTTTGWR